MAGRRWLITGVSGGFGRLLAERALERGDQVAGTLRRQAQLAAFEALAPGRAHGVLLDVTDRAAIPGAVQAAADALGGIDIVVNNAGFGLIGALEELDPDQIDDVIDANLFGTLYVSRAALPHLRASRGALVNFSSYAGFLGMPGVSTYCTAKFGVEGLTESLHGELGALGIRVLLVAPGFFKTNFTAGSLKAARRTMAVYEETAVGQTRRASADPGDYVPADPELVVATIMDALDAPTPPFRLVVGQDALACLRGKIAGLQTALADGEALAANRPPSGA